MDIRLQCVQGQRIQSALIVIISYSIILEVFKTDRVVNSAELLKQTVQVFLSSTSSHVKYNIVLICSAVPRTLSRSNPSLQQIQTWNEE